MIYYYIPGFPGFDMDNDPFSRPAEFAVIQHNAEYLRARFRFYPDSNTTIAQSVSSKRFTSTDHKNILLSTLHVCIIMESLCLLKFFALNK